MKGECRCELDDELDYHWRWDWLREVSCPVHGPSDRRVRFLLMTLGALWMDEDGRAWPSQEAISAAMSYSTKTIRALVELASSAGWLGQTRQGRRGRGWRYVYESQRPIDRESERPSIDAIEGKPESPSKESIDGHFEPLIGNSGSIDRTPRGSEEHTTLEHINRNRERESAPAKPGLRSAGEIAAGIRARLAGPGP